MDPSSAAASAGGSGRTGTANGRLWGRHAHDWAEHQEHQFRAAYQAAFDALAPEPGATLCDVGCGAGLAARIATQRGMRVCGLDASLPLLEIARERLPDGDFRLGDMEALPFADESADIVTGFNSFQYAADPVAALVQARRVARPAGRLVVMTWGAPERMEAATLIAALKPLLLPPPPGAPGPFALSQPGALEALAQAAGWQALQVHDTQTAWTYPNLDAGLRGLGSSGVAARAVEHSGEQAVAEAHRQALAPFRQADGSYRIGVGFRWLLGTRTVLTGLPASG